MRRGGAWSLAGVPLWALASGCVLADPPATLPLVAEYAPVIQTASVVPSYVRPVTAWPGTFLVPVFLSDPTRTIVWKVIVTDSSAPTGLVYPHTQAGGAANASGITTLSVMAPDPGECATVTVVVAFGWSNSNPNVPDSQGGDSLTWQYQPGAACTFYDAGALNDASFPDGTTDGS